MRSGPWPSSETGGYGPGYGWWVAAIRQYTQFLERLVEEKGLTGQVLFLGQVENAFPYIQEADALILCSRCEAFARVVVEAMKAGKPVIGSRSGGTVEQIRDGFNGFLYRPRDYQDLAAKIRTCLAAHPHQAREMGRQGRDWALEPPSTRRVTGRT